MDLLKKSIYVVINIVEAFSLLGVLIYIFVFRYFQSLYFVMQGDYTPEVITLILMIATPFLFTAFDKKVEYLVDIQILKKPKFLNAEGNNKNG